MIPILALCMVALLVTPAAADSWPTGGGETADTESYRQAENDNEDDRKKNLYESIDVIPDLVEFAKKQFKFKDPVLVSPDEGGQERYKIQGFGKNRENSFKVEITGDLEVRDKEVIIIDDLTKSGSTLLRAKDRLLNQGADSVGMAVAHVLPLMERGEELIEEIQSLIGSLFEFDVYPHHFHIHNYISSKELTFHIKIKNDLSVEEGHDIATAIEELIDKKLSIKSTIHLEPLDYAHKND